jgi:hypothetical protein
MKARMLACLATVAMGGVAAAPAVSAAPATVTRPQLTLTPYTVTMATPVASMTLGKTMKVTGVVKGAGASKVTLYQRNGTRWDPWISAKLVNGRYTLNYKPVSAGAHIIRVYTPATTKHRAAASPSKTITVYKWHFLSDFADTSRTVAVQRWASLGDVVGINGHTYIHTPWTWDQYQGLTGFVEYNLSRACLAFQATAGLTDESSSTGASQLEVQTDGVQDWAKTMTLGQSQNLSISVRGGLRLRLQTTVVTTSDGMLKSAFGDARVICRF